ncbi:hypothetical protein [Tatumella morbirosei]|uniref:hypothetical protein n=1 Tax=Tatumella morbirosei TaxID=642227 RepID=UPI00069C9940|nr:hypothetical protein [Tatumella morbirosei]
MNLSLPAMSRTLTRIRDQPGDAILVKNGWEMAATLRALALREQIHLTMENAIQVLHPESTLDLALLDRKFALHANDVIYQYY